MKNTKKALVYTLSVDRNNYGYICFDLHKKHVKYVKMTEKKLTETSPVYRQDEKWPQDVAL